MSNQIADAIEKNFADIFMIFLPKDNYFDNLILQKIICLWKTKFQDDLAIIVLVLSKLDIFLPESVGSCGCRVQDIIITVESKKLSFIL